MRALLAGDWRVTGVVLKIARRIWKVGVTGWTVTDRRWGVLNITAAAGSAGFHWLRSGNITRTQHVSEYMLVFALCLVKTFNQRQFFDDLISNALNLQQWLKVRSGPSNFLVRFNPISCFAS